MAQISAVISSSKVRPFVLRRTLGLSCLLYIVLVAVMVAGIVSANHGLFTYTLDDAYIHLALAENIGRGTYGVNLGQVSAPASSIGWPFLLALFGAWDMAPLVLNVAAALGTLVVFERLVADSLPRAGAGLRLALVILFMLVSNLVGLTFLGMEHTLQVLVAVLLIFTLRQARETSDLRLLTAAMIVNPLVRYENLILCLAVTVYWLGRDVRQAVRLGLLSIVLPALFTVFLLSHGLGVLPTSVMAKTGTSPLVNLSQNVHDSSGLCIVFLMLLFVLAAARRAEPPLALMGALIGAAYLLFGSPGRYAWFAAAALLSLSLVVWRVPLQRLFTRPLRIAMLFLVIGEFALAPLVLMAGIVPLSNNIYEQQYQMHRFVTEFWRAPVAVNDLGWVSYRNGNVVLDLWGLASLPALRLRKANPTESTWVPSLMREQGVDVAMAYASWFPHLDQHLIEVATMSLSGAQMAVADPTVHFYAIDTKASERLRAALADFAPHLPPGLTIDFVSASPSLEP